MFNFIIHYFYYYLKDTFTIKKTKDLVDLQTKKYKSIVDDLLHTKKSDDSYLLDDPLLLRDDDTESIIDYDDMASKLESVINN